MNVFQDGTWCFILLLVVIVIVNSYRLSLGPISLGKELSLVEICTLT